MEIACHRASGPQGDFVVSTIKTFAGGAPVSQPLGAPFSSADYADETPWPFETMVFIAVPSGGLSHYATGQFHRAYRNLRDAKRGHSEVVDMVMIGALPVGQGVRGDFGVPSMTPQEWSEQKANRS
jgi:hypothetical protein